MQALESLRLATAAATGATATGAPTMFLAAKKPHAKHTRRLLRSVGRRHQRRAVCEHFPGRTVAATKRLRRSRCQRSGLLYFSFSVVRIRFASP